MDPNSETTTGIRMINREQIEKLLSDSRYLREHIAEQLYTENGSEEFSQFLARTDIKPSSVLLLLGYYGSDSDVSPEPCLILNKRSEAVRQAGDLCCPGGGVSLPRDANLARLLSLPRSPLKRWIFWKQYQTRSPESAHGLRVLLAASLRESYEEMRLNPLRVSFLGLLPAQRLGAFHRAIYPMVGWASRQRHFKTNWEVDRIVTIPLRNLLQSENYALTRFSMARTNDDARHPNWDNYPCFLLGHEESSEILWGATFRIVMLFLNIVFDFSPPKADALKPVHRVLSSNYYTGSPRRA